MYFIYYYPYILFNYVFTKLSATNYCCSFLSLRLVGIPARSEPRSHAQAKEKETKMKDGSGPNLRDAFAVFDQNGSLLKMCEGCYHRTLEGNLLKFSGAYPAMGMMLNGVLFQPPMLEPRIEEKGSSSWATPNTVDAAHSGRITSSGGQVHIVEQANNWPTPDASVSEGYNQSDSPNAAKRPALAKKAKDWRTPNAELDHHDRGSVEYSVERVRRGFKVSTADQAKARGTPLAKVDAGPTNHGQGSFLEVEAANWRTPTTQDIRHGTLEPSMQKANPFKPCLAHQVMKSHLGPQGQKKETDGIASSKDGRNSPRLWMTPDASTTSSTSKCTGKRPEDSTHLSAQVRIVTHHLRLNPSFVEWLMGFPRDWTSLNPVQKSKVDGTSQKCASMKKG